MLANLMLEQQAGPLVPALHSYWLVIHVGAAILATGAFAVGALASVVFLVKSRMGERRAALLDRFPDADALDRLAYRLHAVGLPAVDVRGADRRADLGGVRLGLLLELGPQGGVGVHHLGGLRGLPARPGDRGLEGQGRRDHRARSASRPCCSTSSASTSSSAPAACTPTPAPDPRAATPARSGARFARRGAQRACAKRRSGSRETSLRYARDVSRARSPMTGRPRGGGRRAPRRPRGS